MTDWHYLLVVSAHVLNFRHAHFDALCDTSVLLIAHAARGDLCFAEWPKAKHELTDGAFGAMQFRAEPATGVLLPGEEANVTLTFAPAAQHRSVHFCQPTCIRAMHMITVTYWYCVSGHQRMELTSQVSAEPSMLSATASIGNLRWS